MPLSPPPKLGWMPLLRDSCHSVLFAVMAWALMRLLMSDTRSATRAIWRTAVVLVLMAAGTELAPSFTGRSMDMADFVRDLAGTAEGIIAALIPHSKTLVVKVLSVGLLAVLFLFAADDLILRARVVWQKSSAFPLLEDFEHRHAWRLWYLEHEGTEVPLKILPAHLGCRAEMAIPAAGLTSLHGDMLGKDWSGWTHLTFDCDLAASSDLVLGLRIDSARDPRKRFSLQAVIKPGPSIVALSLPTTDTAQEILEHAGQIVLFASGPGIQAALRLDNLRLERR